jgi:hypothetical protein
VPTLGPVLTPNEPSPLRLKKKPGRDRLRPGFAAQFTSKWFPPGQLIYSRNARPTLFSTARARRPLLKDLSYFVRQVVISFEIDSQENRFDNLSVTEVKLYGLVDPLSQLLYLHRYLTVHRT